MNSLELENKKLKEDLLKAKSLINLHKDILTNFSLHDDAGTAYLYLGPNPEELDKVLSLAPDLNNMAKEYHLERIIDLLYELDYHQQEVVSGELAQDMHKLMMGLVSEFNVAKKNT